MRFVLLLSLLIFSFSACIETPEEGKLVEDKPFFDLKNYIAAEQNRLQGKTGFTKTVVYNGESETKTLDNLDLQEELSVFADADINRTAWLDKYEIDTTFDSNREIVALTYTAVEEGLKTRRLRVNFSGKNVSKVEIETGGKSAVSDTKSFLTYNPQTGYSIKSKQDIRLLTGNDIFIEIKF